MHKLGDHEKQKELAQAKLNAALLEKEQVSNDLNSLEKSFAELFKRLEKYKTVIEGYKKVSLGDRNPAIPLNQENRGIKCLCPFARMKRL